MTSRTLLCVLAFAACGGDDGATAPVVGLETAGVRSIDLMPDGNVLFFESGDHKLQRVTRPDRSAAFGAPRMIEAPLLGWPTVSADELLLFGNRADQSGSVWAARSDPADPFVEQGSLVVGGACATSGITDADLSPDGTRLLARCGAIYELTR